MAGVRRAVREWAWRNRLVRAVGREALRMFRALKPRRPRHWWLPRRRLAGGAILTVLALALIALAAAAAATAIVSVATGEPLFDWTMVEVKNSCEKTGFACNIATSLFFTALPLVVGGFAFAFVRLRRVRGSFVRTARTRPTELVETAGAIVGGVVGRDDICDVLQEDLRDGKRRRPHVVVGGVGIGKTAVLVRLCEQLARRGAVPVPIRLRDADKDIDFLAMARDRFLRETQSAQRSAAEAERVWLRLCRNDQVVVVADGLEEALAGDGADRERDRRVRVAVTQARKLRYPLVIASRSHTALAALDAALMRLEPLSQEAALDYIQEYRLVDDEHRLGWIVDRANVVETPLYLQLAQELHTNGQLRHPPLETRGADLVMLRVHLIESWVNAMVDGRLDRTAGSPLNQVERQVTVLQLAALACAGLANDTLEVSFENYEASDARGELFESLNDAREDWLECTQLRFPDTPINRSLEVAASNGESLGLVEQRKDGVRFPHSIMQAYLGSLLIGKALADRGLADRLKAPGRELLVAIVMYSRSAPTGARRPMSGEPFPLSVRHLYGEAKSGRSLGEVAADLSTAAKTAQPKNPIKAFELLSTRFEVDTMIKGSPHVDPIDELATAWKSLPPRDPATVDAKLSAIARIGGAARRFADQSRDARSADPTKEANGQAGGSDAPETSDAGAAPDQAVEGKAAESTPRDPAFGLYRRLFEISKTERSYGVRLATAQEIGLGGDDAFHEIAEKYAVRSEEAKKQLLRDALADDDAEREAIVRFWLLPMLVGSVDGKRDEDPRAPRRGGREGTAETDPGGDDRAGDATPAPERADTPAAESPTTRLTEWLKLVGDDDMPLSVEAALAQGFKFAANRRPQHAYENARTRAYLTDRAAAMLKNAKFWYSRLSLLHALGLWALSGSLHVPRGAEPRNYRAIVNRWLRRPDDEPEHPFVLAAGRLVVRALETGHPQRFTWIDETGIATTVGSRSKRDMPHVLRPLWIPPSAGWLGLDREAQQLVADVLLLLNLAERAGAPEERHDRLTRINVLELPFCLTDERRSHLRPTSTAGVMQPAPGEKCKGGCPVGLCPYPPKGLHPYRVELSEAFCRNQRILLGSWKRGISGRRAPWQHAPASELKHFWDDMEDRARA
jgi:hypothetical protein